MNHNWDLEALTQKLKDNPDLARENAGGNGIIQEEAEKRPESRHLGIKESKYRAVRTGHYHSKKEAEFAKTLELRKQAGEISFWLEQVKFPLPGNTSYRLDFMVFTNNIKGGGRCPECGADLIPMFYEVKGFKVRLGEIKRKQTEEIYGIHIEVV